MEIQTKLRPVIQILAKNFKLGITLNYFFELELSLIQILNYSETYFELDSEEATYCHHCHLICFVYIKWLVNAKDQSNGCVSENDVKRVKEALIVLIVTHVTQVERVENGVCGFYATLYRVMLLILLTLKGSKWGMKTLLYSVYRGLSPSRREGLYSLSSCGFSCSPPVSLRRQLC